MMKKTAAEMIVDGIVATGKIVAGLIELACEVDQTIEQRKRTEELRKQTEIMKQETAVKKEQFRIKMEEERKRTALIREKKLAEMTPEERLEFEISERIERINLRLA